MNFEVQPNLESQNYTHGYPIVDSDSDDILKYTDSIKRNKDNIKGYKTDKIASTRPLSSKDNKKIDDHNKIKAKPKALDYQTFGNSESSVKDIPEQQKFIQEAPDVEESLKIPASTEEYETNKDSETPILYLDVNFGQGNVTRIVMYENDTPEELADAFCQEHNLDTDKKTKLINIIKKHLDSVLDKIDETSNE